MSKWNKESLSTIVKQSMCVSDVCRALGITSTASNYKTFYKYAKKYNISTSHFDPRRSEGMKSASDNKRFPDDVVFVENSTYPQAPLRKRIKNNNIIPYKCSSCDIEDMWNNKKISLQLDHINGINTDNRLQNLRWLCPNCHSQTHTYAGRNK